jgi:hypothetical protein
MKTRIAIYRGEMVEVTRFAELDGKVLYECYMLEGAHYLGLLPVEELRFALDSNYDNLAANFEDVQGKEPEFAVTLDDMKFLKALKIGV